MSLTTTRTIGLGLGFGLATAVKPPTPNDCLARGAAAFGATTAGAATTRATRLASEVVVLAAADVAVTAVAPAWAGSANAATRPPEAAMTAELFTAGWADLARMSPISDRGLYRPGARWRPLAAF